MPKSLPLSALGIMLFCNVAWALNIVVSKIAVRTLGLPPLFYTVLRSGTVLLVLFPLLPLPRIVAADIAYAVPLTLVAGMGHASLGSVDWPLLLNLLVGSLPGIWIGSRLMSKTPERLIRSLLSVLLAWAGTKLVMVA